LGEAHPNTLISMDNVALLYRNQGKYAQAEPLVTKVLGEERHVLGDEHPDTLITMNNLAGLYRDQGKTAQAEMLYIKLLELQRRVLGAEHPRRLASMKDLAVLYLNQFKYQQAETLLRQALESYQKSTTSTWDRYHCETMLGASLAGQKKYADAEVLLLSGYQGMLQRQATTPASNRLKLGQAGERIVLLYQDWGKPEKATEWRKKLRRPHPMPAQHN
jgi:tetratricopeptide (TPR) repeat protein